MVTPRVGGAHRRRVSIAHKLGAVMTFLLLVLVLVLGIEVVEIDRQTDDVRRQTALAVSADGPSRLLISLQNERSWAAVELVGQGDAAELIMEGYDETRRATDEALAGFVDLLERSPETTRRAFAPAMEGVVAELASVREQIDTSTSPRNLDNFSFSREVFAGYSQIVDPFFGGITEIAVAIDPHDLRRGAELIDLSSRQVEVLGLLAQEVATTSLLTEGGVDTRDEIVTVSGLHAQFSTLAAQIRALSTGPYAGAGDDELFVGLTDAMTRLVDGAMAGNFEVQDLLTTVARPPEETYPGYRERVATILHERADRLSDAAAQRERVYLLLMALTVGLAIVVLVVVSRSIIRPLQSLTRQVTDTAHHSLRQAVASVLEAPMGADVRVPAIEPIVVDAGEDVAHVAEVMNTVQRAVVDLALEQAMLRRNLADSFVSLGRRNQNLLSRQLDFITELQRNEVEPEVLGQLFRLDHLATRMRRNAESLLVLAGNESPRRWRAPVGIVDVVRAALSEVEEYQRVRLRHIDPFTVIGNAAADLAHLLAELIDNALLFSLHDELVEVRGMTQPAGYSLAVIDAGVGMSPAEIAVANRRLAGAESFTVAPSKYLGHYVAGSLAVRHGIHVSLQHSAGRGVTAIVHLPRSVSPADGLVPTPNLV